MRPFIFGWTPHNFQANLFPSSWSETAPTEIEPKIYSDENLHKQPPHPNTLSVAAEASEIEKKKDQCLGAL